MGAGILVLASTANTRCGLALLRKAAKWLIRQTTTGSVSQLSEKPAQVFGNRQLDASFEILKS